MLNSSQAATTTICLVVLATLIQIKLSKPLKAQEGRSSLFSTSGLLVLAPFIVATLSRVFSLTYVPDEAVFLAYGNGILNSRSVFNVLFPPNLEGFGGAFWAIVAFALSIAHGTVAAARAFGLPTNDFLSLPNQVDSQYLYGSLNDQHFGYILAIWIIRLVVAATVISFFWALATQIMKLRKDLQYMLVGIITLPIFWWSGKLASPELISASLIGLSVLQLGRKKILQSVALASFAVGFKISALPAALTILLIIPFSKELRGFLKTRKNIFKTFGMIVLPALLCNTYVLLNFEQFVANGKRVTPTGDFSKLLGNLPKEIWSAWTNMNVSWDYVTISGLTYWTGSFVGLIALLSLFFFSKKIFFATLAITLIGIQSLSLIQANATPYSWYYFPVIFFVISLLAISLPSLPVKREKSVIVVTFLITLFNIPAASEEFSLQLSGNSDLANISKQENCLLNYIREYDQIQIVDAAVIGLRFLGPESKTHVDLGQSILNPTENNTQAVILGEKGNSLWKQLNRLNQQNTLIGTCSTPGNFNVFEVGKND